MPVNILYCEGVPGGPDISLLQMVLVNTCNVYPAGGKENFGPGIQMARRAVPALNICGLRDRDFDGEKPVPDGNPIPWNITEDHNLVSLGWKWERREIENYLIDPQVVQRAFGHSFSPFPAPDPVAYTQELNRAADQVAIYTAARTALSLSRTPARLINFFHPHDTESECRAALHRILSDYHTDLPQETRVLEKFDAILPECQAGGNRRQHFLTFFAGKDLLMGMNNFFSRTGFKNWNAFLKAVLLGMSRASDPVWEWLPEWQNLRQQIQLSTLERGLQN